MQPEPTTVVALELDTAAVASFASFADAVRAALSERWSRDRFDFLVNNAGTMAMAPFALTSEVQFDEMVAVHFKGTFFLTQQLIGLLADGGAIVNLSSGLTRSTVPGSSAYAAAKGAVEVLTRHLAHELGARGITVNTVAPGPIATDLGGGHLRSDEHLREIVAGAAALGRVGSPEDVAGVIAALLSPGCRWITGQRIEPSGGMAL